MNELAEIQGVLIARQIIALETEEEPNMIEWRKDAIKQIAACTTYGQVIDFLINACGDNTVENATLHVLQSNTGLVTME